ncbi:hypothetical protein [Paenibacillus sp. BK720]|uniref:hypothetical protein n=1 Tax=Paenibacillus sp. BK720 TaxID=2587092 RepID=UPI0014234B7A|nr:hypothetical protein [Paenibacillus sp. BK720]NIK67909.1 hypothetical protein [Paenibacillus sp. BK720]
MDRAVRKRRQRQIDAWADRKTFVQEEIIVANYRAYEMGVGHALDAVAEMYGMGDVRITRLQEKLQLVQMVEGVGTEGKTRKTLEKAAASFDSKYSFAKAKAAEMNVVGYQIAMDHVQDAVSIVYSLGEKRMAAWLKTVERIQQEDNLQAFTSTGSPEHGNPFALALRRALRLEQTDKLSDQAKAAIGSLVRI